MRLEALGAIATQHDEFGEIVVAARAENVCFVPTHLVRDPRRAFVHICAELTEPVVAKLMALMRLRWQGWSLCDNMPKPTFVGALARHVWASVPLGPAAYFEALLNCEAIFAKHDNISIFHGMPASYYECLLGLADLTSIVGLGDEIRRQKAKFFQELLETGAVEVPAHEADAMLAALEDDYGEEFVPVDAAVWAEALGRHVGFLRTPIVYERPEMEEGLTINFDRCTHASGMQRAFVSCPHHKDESCRRYVFVHNFETRVHAAAWLVAWALQEPVAATKLAHYASEPDAELLADVLSDLA